MPSVDILEMGPVQKKHQLRNILNSYHHDWDILAELCQNAVDAIRKREKYPKGTKGKIEIEIDSAEKSIKVRDNGIGMSLTDLEGNLRPHATSKFEDAETIGEKGVGLTFAAWSCSDFELKTCAVGKKKTANGILKNGYDWLSSIDSEEHPLMDVFETDEAFEGTEVSLRKIRIADHFFNYNTEKIKYFLRTRTAIGNTKVLWGEKDIDITVELTHKWGGETSHMEIPFAYLDPKELLEKNEVADFNDFRTWLNSGPRSEEQQRNKLRQKLIIYRSLERTPIRNGQSREVKVFMAFYPEWEKWLDLSSKLGVYSDKDKDLDNGDEEDFILANKLTLSVKGMPTGITIQHPRTYSSARWKTIFFMIEDPEASLDIGRKSVKTEQEADYKEVARKVFKEIVPNRFEVLFGKRELESNPEDLLMSITDAVERPDLGYEFLNFQKIPGSQEAAVAAIFFECLGKGIIRDIFPLYTSYGAQYDLIAKVRKASKLPVKVFEFKHSLRDIVDDFENDKKYLNDVDAVICWEVGDRDREVLTKNKVEFDVLENDSDALPHATHWMKITFTKKVYVLDLKLILEHYRTHAK